MRRSRARGTECCGDMSCAANESCSEAASALNPENQKNLRRVGEGGDGRRMRPVNRLRESGALAQGRSRCWPLRQWSAQRQPPQRLEARADDMLSQDDDVPVTESCEGGQSVSVLGVPPAAPCARRHNGLTHPAAAYPCCEGGPTAVPGPGPAWYIMPSSAAPRPPTRALLSPTRPQRESGEYGGACAARGHGEARCCAGTTVRTSPG